jgi:hypothetical protein
MCDSKNFRLGTENIFPQNVWNKNSPCEVKFSFSDLSIKARLSQHCFTKYVILTCLTKGKQYFGCLKRCNFHYK